jgi:hypothetical protein
MKDGLYLGLSYTSEQLEYRKIEDKENISLEGQISISRTNRKEKN